MTDAEAKIAMASAAAQVLIDLVLGHELVTHVLSTKSEPAQDDADRWPITLRTTGGWLLTFHMEGYNVASLAGCVAANGEHLIGPKNPIAALEMLNGDQQQVLDQVVIQAHAQQCAI